MSKLDEVKRKLENARGSNPSRWVGLQILEWGAPEDLAWAVRVIEAAIELRDDVVGCAAYRRTAYLRRAVAALDAALDGPPTP